MHKRVSIGMLIRFGFGRSTEKHPTAHMWQLLRSHDNAIGVVRKLTASSEQMRPSRARASVNRLVRFPDGDKKYAPINSRRAYAR